MMIGSSNNKVSFVFISLAVDLKVTNCRSKHLKHVHICRQDFFH